VHLTSLTSFLPLGERLRRQSRPPESSQRELNAVAGCTTGSPTPPYKKVGAQIRDGVLSLYHQEWL
jgi:hypothetical protein